jgi:long-chain acyl-CoA synthetase
MRTIINLFEESVNKYADNVYLWEHDGNKYIGTTFKETKERVYAFGSGLMKLGLMPGDRVTLIAEGCNDWVVSELGILYNGAVNVPLSVKLSEPEEIRFRLSHSGSKIVITTKGQIQKILDIIGSLPDLKHIICLNDFQDKHKKVINAQDLMRDGLEFLKTHKEEFEKRFKSVQENDYANICYTSGTTADPKGIILSHLNYVANVEQSGSLFDIPTWYSTLLILPWDHAFAHTCGIYTLMKHGASLASIQSGTTPFDTIKNIPKNIKELKPDFLLSVPALAKNFRKNIEKGIQGKGKMAERLFNHALKIAYKYNGNGWNRGKGLKILYWPLYNLYDSILLSKVREGFGGKMNFFTGGGALLDIELQRFFYAIGIPMYQGYGLTEAAPVISSNSIKKHKLGSSGSLASGIELKICNDEGEELPIGDKGEIVIRGENVMMGYWQNDSATNESLKNGWLYTGDLGYLDNDGFLYVLGRSKSLLIADDGEKFSPEGIEEAFSEKSPFIEQCMLYNNQKPFTICLLYPSRDAMLRYISENNFTKEERIDKAIEKIDHEITKYKKSGEFEAMFPYRWLPAAIGILYEGFSEENRMMNSTLKIVRPKINEKYESFISYLYTPEAKNIYNPKNREAMIKLIG